MTIIISNKTNEENVGTHHMHSEKTRVIMIISRADNPWNRGGGGGGGGVCGNNFDYSERVLPFLYGIFYMRVLPLLLMHLEKKTPKTFLHFSFRKYRDINPTKLTGQTRKISEFVIC